MIAAGENVSHVSSVRQVLFDLYLPLDPLSTIHDNDVIGNRTATSSRNGMKPKDTTVLNLREMPLELVSRLKAAAALSSPPVTMRQYVIDMLQAHLDELVRKGALPKLK